MLRCMRTTLSLDKDVAAALERLRKARKASLKDVVNEALRRGLGQMASPPAAPRKPFRTRAVSLGRCFAGNVDNVSEVLAVAEGESFK
jgi:Ribbon-helix-helix protein, copG family